MLGVEDYGSGSDSDTEGPVQPKKIPSKAAPAKKKKTIAIGLPTLKPDEDDHLDIERPPAKRAKLGAGVGSSSLLSMLPAPKQKNPVPAAAPERVLGGGKGPGLVFNDSTPGPVEESASSSTSFAFRPPSLIKGKANISLEEDRPKAFARSTAPSSAPAVDFFGIGSATASSSTAASTSSGPSVSISSAPDVASFEVPEPTVNDPYPGYYQLPSGEWRQHDFEYYEKFRKKWEKEYNDHVRALEKGTAKGFEGYEQQEVAEVNAAKEMERAKVEIKEREERKAVSKTSGAPEKPRMNITAAKLSGRARSRHQLATLLNEAYENRDALEEKIAEGRRNRKEAGNKYGF